MPAPQPVLCLASASPRRRALLEQINVAYIARGANIDETPYRNEAPHAYVARMAAAKARAVRSRDESLPVLGADTSVVVDGIMLGKPDGRAAGLVMLRSLSGRVHEVLTAVALADA